MQRVEVAKDERCKGVYRVTLETGARRLATLNVDPGRSVYGERLIKYEKNEYRLWDPYRSKLAAFILKSGSTIPIVPGATVLYLGAASGTTASHVSDIVGPEGFVYCVEFSSRVMRELVDNVCRHRLNMAPILADARIPEKYQQIAEQVDVVYCDVAQPEQAKILYDNAESFLKREGKGMIAVKARSIDVTLTPSSVFKKETEILKRYGFEILKSERLEPYDEDHIMIVVAWK